MYSFLRLFVLLGLALGVAACDAATPTPPPHSATPAAAGPAATADGATAAENLQRAKDALAQKNFPLAVEQAEAAARKDANNSEIQFVLGNVYNQQASQSGDTARREQLFNKAIGAYQAAIKINPNNDAAHTNLGTVYYQMGNFDGARQAAEAALRIKPGDASTHYLLGTILLQSDPTKDPSLLDKAKEQFELAIKNESGLGAAYIGLANVYLFKKDYVNALAQAQKGVDLMKPDPDPFALWALAQAQCAGGNKAAGTQTLQQILSKNVPDAVFVQQVQATMAQCK